MITEEFSAVQSDASAEAADSLNETGLEFISGMGCRLQLETAFKGISACARISSWHTKAVLFAGCSVETALSELSRLVFVALQSRSSYCCGCEPLWIMPATAIKSYSNQGTWLFPRRLQRLPRNASVSTALRTTLRVWVSIVFETRTNKKPICCRFVSWTRPMSWNGTWKSQR